MQELLSFVLEIEQKLKRVRTIENGPRTIDLDILFYEDEILAKENLVVPHPRLHERAFVLVPLCEIAHPVVKKSVSNILEDLPQKEEVRLYKKDWL